jgi:hypothetical protein
MKKISKIDIIEGNALIIEIMNYHKTKQTDNQLRPIYRVKILGHSTLHTIGTMPHHKSWDWLMPVLEKIENIVGLYTPNILIQYHACIIEDEDVYGLFKFQNSDNSKIIAVWKSVIEFLKWRKNLQL